MNQARNGNGKRAVVSVVTVSLLTLALVSAASAGRELSGVTPTGFLLPRDSTVVHRDGSVEVFSLTRLCRLVARAVDRGSDTFSLEGASVWRRDSLLYQLSESCGDGLYVADSGWLATVTPVDNPWWGNRVVRLYAPDGVLVAQGTVKAPHAFAFAQSGRTFVAAGSEETLVLASAGKQVWRLPKSLLVAASADGEVWATADTELVRVWKQGVETTRFRTPEWCVRSLAVDEQGKTVAVATRRRLVVWDVGRQRRLFERTTSRGQTFREVRFVRGQLAVGLQNRSEDSVSGVLLLMDRTGQVLSRRVSSKSPLPSRGRALRKGSARAKKRPLIRWPYAPFDSAYAIGNTYEEFQCYGTRPYLHPGTDLLAPPQTPVYSVSEGVVKAVLTISGRWHWRIAVADSAGPDTTEGWLYAHLEQSSIAFGVGDTVHLGDYLGRLVTWPVNDFHHCHFVKVREAGEVWSGDWDAVFNPLDVLRPRADSTAPVFEKVRFGDGHQALAAFCENETDHYLSPDSLHGKVDVVVRVGDYVGSAEWLCSVYELSYTVRSLDRDSVVVGPVLAARLSHVIPHYLGTPALAHVLYKDDEMLHSYGDYRSRIFYHVVTNSDGDSLLELSDAQEALNTTALPDGPYEITVVARDADGNESLWRVPFQIRNHTTSGVARPGKGETPGSFRVAPPHPNPFNAETVVEGTAPGTGPVHVNVFDARGRLVYRDVVKARRNRFRWTWSALQRPSGVYLARFTCGSTRRVVKLLLLR